MTASSSSQPWLDRAPEDLSSETASNTRFGSLSVVSSTSSPTALVSDPPPGPQARVFDPQLSGLRDLTYARALLDATERMHHQPDLTTLLQNVVAEALTIVSADGAALVRYTGMRRTLVETYLDVGVDDKSLVSNTIRGLLVGGWLFRPGHVSDLHQDLRWLDRAAQVRVPPWRSLMVVRVACPVRMDQLRLVWFSSVPRCFAGLSDVGALFGRHAGLAVRLVAGRMSSSSPTG